LVVGWWREDVAVGKTMVMVAILKNRCCGEHVI
jgi:hypothetical protein